MAGTRQTALVTGASSGIGLELCRGLAERGFDLILVARNEARLTALSEEVSTQHAVTAKPLVFDLAEPGAPQQIYDKLKTQGTRIDVLVNNAGFGAHGAFAALPLQRQLEMIAVNITALTALTRLFLPDMLERRQGKILNLASMTAFQPGPNMAVYYASKSYVLSLSEALAEELVGTGVSVTCLCPGATKTGFAATAEMEGSLIFRIAPMDARSVARQGIAAMLAGKRLLVPGVLNRMMVFSVRLAPRALVPKIVKQLQP
ncbi:MAG TPA: SDR family oxidoreductase [Methylovirgula sp.]|nr:SDR family oxidoreductase [Methylovirgula sp.]